MPAQIVYDGVNGRYEGTLFNGIKFWVSRRIPTRDPILKQITDNGGKVVLLEKHADVLIGDHLKKYTAPAGSVSWKYIDDSVAQGELPDINGYKIHEAVVSRPIGWSAPTKNTRTPFTPLDIQILVTWVRQKERSGELKGNAVWQELAEQYPHHTWQSWRGKWTKECCQLPEGQLPAALPELQPPNRQPSPAVDAAPVAATPVAARPRPSQAQANSVPESTPQADRSLPKGRNFFTREEDKLLTQHIEECDEAGLPLNGNKIYISFAENHTNHSWHSWRDRWIRHLSQRPRGVTPEDEEAGHEPARRQPRPAPAANRLPANQPRSQAPPARAPPRPPQRPPRDPPQPTQAAAAPSATRGTTAQPGSRLQDLARKRARIQAARTIQRVWRGYQVRRNVQDASEAIVAFQAGAQGFLVRTALGLDEGEDEHEPEGTAWFTAVEPVPLREDPLLPEGGLDGGEGENEEEEAKLDEAGGEVEEKEAALDKAESEPGRAAAAPAAAPAPASATSQQPAPAAPRDALNISQQEFWEFFNQFCDVDGIDPSPWVQIGPSAVSFWDLWRCATAESRHASRDWEVVAENLGFDWIAEPHVPLLLKAAFEKHLLGFEEQLAEFGLLGDSEGGEEVGEEREDGDEGEDAEEDEDGGQAAHEETVPEASDGNFVSSPPVAGLKRLRSSSALTPRAVSKRPRHDPSSEIPCTPDSRTEQSAPTEPEAQGFRHAAQLDGAEDDDLTPSRQLQFETEEYSPVKRTPRNPQRAGPSSANQPIPSVEHDEDETSDSSDAFESPSKLPIKKFPTRRALPWSTTNQPTITQPPPRQTPNQPPPNPSPSPFIPSSASASSSAPLDPTPIFNHFRAMRYPPSQIAAALHATTTHLLPSKNLVHVVLDALMQGEVIPANRSGVWTNRDDEKLKGVGQLVDRLERGENIPSSVGRDEMKEMLRGLVGKHGREAVAGRRKYLKAWERA